MDTLRSYLNSLSREEKIAFALRAGTSIGYLRKALSVKQRIGEGTCIKITEASNGQVRPEELRPDVNWSVLSGQHKDQA